MLKRHSRVALNQKLKARRSGLALVELAFVTPVFLVFVYAIFEFGYAYMISNIIQEATQEGAKLGRCEEVTTAQVETKVKALLNTVFDADLAEVMVKDASQFDTPGVDVSQINYKTLPDLELANAQKAQLFLVRVEVPYKDVRLLSSFFVDPVEAAEAAAKEDSMVLSGHSVRRHE
ncbi:TadE/TadG family type IV pilus assembly protein [Gimesia maris]|uniref:TadE/TadG family type IV pilus assembly protein n=1 Tax=Gimesia maris TaxID=122 RepID=UPI00118BDCF5|nr:TadE/TadG family type IV pilus assembly protein [Gimesia maris]QDU14965.1 TadE-like protein [Gimesia maris]|tara:strand:- start:3387 stop:3914 length:528 start_codon:yes stop_codon:yes gene_type:complete